MVIFGIGITDMHALDVAIRMQNITMNEAQHSIKAPVSMSVCRADPPSLILPGMTYIMAEYAIATYIKISRFT